MLLYSNAMKTQAAGLEAISSFYFWYLKDVDLDVFAISKLK